MQNEPFANRVQALRDSWAERRQVRGIASVHDFASQFRLLEAMHGWAEHAVAEIRAVYGESVAASVTPLAGPPAGHREEERGFAVTVGAGFGAAFVLHDRRRLPGPSWSVSVSVASSGPGGTQAPAGPERRNGQWTRTRLEEVLLLLVAAYERSLAAAEDSHFTIAGTNDYVA